MLLDGISIQGSYHDHNQDSFKYKKLDKGFVVALSDGLGSKKNSKIGSSSICESAIDISEQLKDSLRTISIEEYIQKVYDSWLEKVWNYEIKECYATMLIFLIYSGRIIAARLGDGFIGIWADNNMKILFDRKEDYFANETDCLTENIDFEKIELYELEVSELHGGVMCSDGVGIGNMTETELSNFTRDFVVGYCGMSQSEVTSDIGEWIRDWPGADDKTLAYFVSERN